METITSQYSFIQDDLIYVELCDVYVPISIVRQESCAFTNMCPLRIRITRGIFYAPEKSRTFMLRHKLKHRYFWYFKKPSITVGSRCQRENSHYCLGKRIVVYPGYIFC